MVQTRRESHHSDGITDQKRPQPPFATKSPKSGHRNLLELGGARLQGALDNLASGILEG